MIRGWPEGNGEDELIISYPRKSSMANTVVCGVFFVFGALGMMLGMKIAFQDGWDLMLVFGLLCLAAFTLALGIAGFSGMRELLGTPRKLIVADSGGVYLDIVVGGDRVFFLGWPEVEGFGVGSAAGPFWEDGGVRTKGEALSVRILPSSDTVFPSVVKNAKGSKREMLFTPHSLDMPLADAVERLNRRKGLYG